MNRERAKELLPIIQAFAEGKNIQFKHVRDMTFTTKKEDDLSFHDEFEYRIKPEPREFWINAEDNEFRRVYEYDHHKLVNPNIDVDYWIHVREVIE